MQQTYTDDFVAPCLTCGSTVHFKSGSEVPHACEPASNTAGLIAVAWWAGHDHAAGATSAPPPRRRGLARLIAKAVDR